MGPLLIPDCNRLEYKQLVQYNIVQLGPSTFLPNPNYLKVDNLFTVQVYKDWAMVRLYRCITGLSIVHMPHNWPSLECKPLLQFNCTAL